MQYTSLISFLKQTMHNWSEDNIPTLSAALAYYTIFSLAPLLIIALSVAGIFFGQQGAEEKIFIELRAALGPQSAEFLQTLVSQQQARTSIIATIIGVIILFFTASGVVSQIQKSLQTIWKAPHQHTSHWHKAVRNKLLALGILCIAGILLLVSLVASTVVQRIAPTLFNSFWLQSGMLIISCTLYAGLFGMMYKFFAHTKISWKDSLIGGSVTSLLFTISKIVIGLYIGSGAVATGFGAATAIIILLVWVYYSALIFYFGAELTHTYTFVYGSLKQPLTLRGILWSYLPKINRR